MIKPIRSSIYACLGTNPHYKQFHSYTEFTSFLEGKNEVSNILLLYLTNNVEFLFLKLTPRQNTWQVTNIANNDPWFTFTCEMKDRLNLLNIFEQTLWKKIEV